MIGTCWSSSFMISLIKSAARPVSLFDPAARAFREVIRVRVGTTTAETPAARVRKDRRDGASGSPWALVGPLTARVSVSVKAFTLGWNVDRRIRSLLLSKEAVQ